MTCVLVAVGTRSRKIVRAGIVIGGAAYASRAPGASRAAGAAGAAKTTTRGSCSRQLFLCFLERVIPKRIERASVSDEHQHCARRRSNETRNQIPIHVDLVCRSSAFTKLLER